MPDINIMKKQAYTTEKLLPGQAPDITGKWTDMVVQHLEDKSIAVCAHERLPYRLEASAGFHTAGILASIMACVWYPPGQQIPLVWT